MLAKAEETEETLPEEPEEEAQAEGSTESDS